MTSFSNIAAEELSAQEQDPPINENIRHDANYIVARRSEYGMVPIEMDCPHCKLHIVSHIQKIAGPFPWILCAIFAAIGIFLLLIPWCFCCVPFFFDFFLDVVHTCPACKQFLGRYYRLNQW